MSDDTTNKSLDTAATRKVANTDKEEARSNDARSTETERTTAALLARSLQARFAAVARQSVALALARFGADQFTHFTTGDYCHGFPEGSDYGALCPQDDLSEPQAEGIFRSAGEAVQAEARHMTEGASPEMAALLTLALAQWEEGAALEWANMTRIRENLDREEAKDAEKGAEKDARAAAGSPSPRLYLGRPLTPGMEYVEDWLGGMEAGRVSSEWLAQNIDEGFFVDCHRCHFLHPARPAWHLGHTKGTPERADACDVCSHVPAAVQFVFHHESLRQVLDHAPSALSEARQARAERLYDLWLTGSVAADLWVWSEMQRAVQKVEEAAKRGEKKAA